MRRRDRQGNGPTPAYSVDERPPSISAPSQLSVATTPESTGCGIAVIGMACRFPGANTPEEFWQNLARGHESLVTPTDDELRAAGVAEKALRDPSYVRASMRLQDYDRFDAGFFGFSPRDAAILDPQHRQFLECSWEALEHAGYDPERFDGSIGVFGGSGHNAYLHLNLLGNKTLEEQVGLFLLRHTGNDKDFLTTRVSHALNLRGPSVNVQTACSTSLVAVHLAASSLMSLECDIALAGGVTIVMPAGHGYHFREGEILSPDGHCRPFDQSASGTVFGSGVGLVVLRRLDDALAAGDTIHAVILGSAVNNDGGAKSSYLAPSVDGQAAAAREALLVADIDPATVSFIECHGTGTAIGDAIEVAALREAYGSNVGGGECVLGSVKGNIGHLDTAAGAAGLIKTILAMKHRLLPGTLHFASPGDHLVGNSPPFVVRPEARPWNAPERMRAGINSLGVGGTNAHVLLESPPARARSADDRDIQLLPLSARSATALRHRVADLHAALGNAALGNATLGNAVTASDAHPLPDIAWTLQQGRHRFDHRVVVPATSVNEARARLGALLDGGDRAIGAPVLPDATGLTMLFAGGGSGYAGMGRGLYETESAYRKAVDRACAIAREQRLVDYDLRRLLVDVDGGEGLERPTRGLPALFVTQYACAQLWESMGVVPTAVIGHSVGEYAAACVAGVLSLEDSLRIVVRRGELFEEMLAGAMLSVMAPESVLRALLPPALSVAAVNAPEITVASGPLADVIELENMLAARGIEYQRVPIDVAAHSPMLDPILFEFADALSRLRFRPPRLRMASNITGGWLSAAQATDPGYWLRQLREPVRFADGFALLARDSHVHLEVGPGKVLASLVRQQPGFDARHRAISSMRHAREAVDDRTRFHEAFGALWQAGVQVDWTHVHDVGARRRVPLPTYPFEHQRHWFEPPRALGASDSAPPPAHEWCEHEVWEPQPFEPRAASDVLHGLCVLGDDVDDIFAALPADVESRRLDGIDPGALRDALRSLRAGLSWHVVSVVDSGDDGPRALERALLRLKHEAEAMIEVAPAVAGWRILVRGAAVLPLGDGTTRVSPVAKAIVAAARVLRTELDCDVRVIDWLAIPEGTERMLAEIVGGTEEVVAVRGNRRFVPRHRALALPPFTRSPFAPDGCCVITGGLGGLGLAIAGHLARSGWKRIALLARHALPALDEADREFHESSLSGTAQRVAAVAALRELGVDVRTFQVDVTDETALRRTWHEVDATMGPVRLALHAAGVLDDALMGARADHDLSALIAPKAAAATLVSLCGDTPLVLFSSTSVHAGIPGQFDYAAANAYMDGLAENARADGRPVLAVEWGAWRDVGMLARLASPSQAPSYAPSPAPSRPHPLSLGATIRRRRNNCYERVIAGSDWVVAEHRTRAGTALLPGTALLALLVESLGTEHAALGDVSLMQPLVLPPDARRVVQVSREGDRLVLRSALDADAAERDEWIAEHAEARVVPLSGGPRQLRRSALEARCRSARTFPGRGIDHAQMAFGPRWSCVDSIRYGEGEALIALSLDPSVWHDLTTWPIHPALLDMATGAAQELLPDSDRDFFVPQSYREVRVMSPLAPIVISHVRRVASGADRCEFDVSVADEEGRLLLSIDGFRLRRMPAAAFDDLRASGRPGARAPMATLVERLERGIAPADGAALLVRLVEQVRSGVVTASPVTIDEVRRGREPLVPTARAAGSDGPGPRHRAPSASAKERPARSNREQQLAALWQEALGIHEIGADDDFFELGGHSLLLTKVATRARKQLGITLPLLRLFDKPTISGWLAESSDSAVARPTGRLPLTPVPRAAYVAPDPAQ